MIAFPLFVQIIDLQVKASIFSSVWHFGEIYLIQKHNIVIFSALPWGLTNAKHKESSLYCVNELCAMNTELGSRSKHILTTRISINIFMRILCFESLIKNTIYQDRIHKSRGGHEVHHFQGIASLTLFTEQILLFIYLLSIIAVLHFKSSSWVKANHKAAIYTGRVTRLDGARGKKNKFGAPLVGAWDPSEENVLLKKVFATLLGLFRDPAVIQRPHSDSAPGELPPLLPLYGSEHISTQSLKNVCRARAAKIWTLPHKQ